MAGLAESCSHVGAILFAVAAGVSLRESTTCTMEKSKWLMPSYVNQIPAAPVSQIDFSSAKAKKRRIEEAISGSPTTLTPSNRASCPTIKPGSDEYKQFFKNLSKNFNKSAALMTKPDYHKTFIPKSATDGLPKSIMDYRTADSENLPLNDLKQHCKDLKLKELTQSQITAVERETRRQSSSCVWYRQRAGRITASKLKQVLSTNPEKPAKSLIKSICYPEAHRFSSAATSYGCKHEAEARRAYERLMQEEHDNFSVIESGLRLNAKWPYLGASPDGVIICSCHGSGACEIKCPRCKRDKENISQCAGSKGFCLIKEGDVVKLDRQHPYYYQVQAQLHIMEAEYCHFVVWNKNDMSVERILPDVELWNSVIPKVECFFRQCILPEVLGKQFTRQVFNACSPQNSSRIMEKPKTTHFI